VHLALTYCSNREKLEALVFELKKTVDVENLNISIHKADLSSPTDISSLIAEVEAEHGRHVEILVANAGYGKRIVNIWDIELEQFETAFNVNLRAPFLLVKGVVDGMRKSRWGRIVFISSIAASGGGINGCRRLARSS
jgi:3-oxoacyl-[acyl-carrier protein] reductase